MIPRQPTRLALIVLLGASLSVASSRAQLKLHNRETAAPLDAAPRSDTDVRAMLLLRIASFVSWPEWPATKQDFVVGVIEWSAQLQSLRAAAPTERVHGLPVRIVALREDSPLPPLDVLLVDPDLIRRLPYYAAELGTMPVLVATHGEGALRRGAALNFFAEENRLRFEVRPSALSERGLKASYKLLSLARVVKD